MEEQELFYNKLLKGTSNFLALMSHTNFEDGTNNEVYSIVDKWLKENYDETKRYLSYLYFHKMEYRIYDSLNENILRIISYCIPDNKMIDFYPEIADAIYRTELQEPAIMCIEKLRTLPCIYLLRYAPYNSKFVADYAKKVEKELRSELKED